MEKEQIIWKATPYRELKCVYFLIKDSEIVYIGKTNEFFERISRHNRNIEFDSYYYIETPPEKQDEVENFYIIKFQPKHNKTINKLEGYITKQESLKKY